MVTELVYRMLGTLKQSTHELPRKDTSIAWVVSCCECQVKNCVPGML